jgi:hypothetical protein
VGADDSGDGFEAAADGAEEDEAGVCEEFAALPLFEAPQPLTANVNKSAKTRKSGKRFMDFIRSVLL